MDKKCLQEIITWLEWKLRPKLYNPSADKTSAEEVKKIFEGMLEEDDLRQFEKVKEWLR